MARPSHGQAGLMSYSAVMWDAFFRETTKLAISLNPVPRAVGMTPKPNRVLTPGARTNAKGMMRHTSPVPAPSSGDLSSKITSAVTPKPNVPQPSSNPVRVGGT